MRLDAQNNGTIARRALCRVLRRNDALLPCARDRRRQDRPFASVYRRRPAPRAFGSLVPDYPTTVRTDFPHFGARASPESFPAAFRPTARTLSPQGNNGRITPFSCAALPGRLSFSNRYPNEDFARLSSGRSNPKTVCDRIRPIGRVAIVTQYSRKRKRT